MQVTRQTYTHARTHTHAHTHTLKHARAHKRKENLTAYSNIGVSGQRVLNVIESAPVDKKRVGFFFIYSRAYWIKTPSGNVETTCDMDNGGWTLIGEDGGYTENKFDGWLRKNRFVHLLAEGTNIEAGVYASIDAVNLAVNNATKVGL